MSETHTAFCPYCAQAIEVRRGMVRNKFSRGLRPFAIGIGLRGDQQNSDPCSACDGTGKLDVQTTILDIARRHGTRVAADWANVSTNTVVALRKKHDGYERGRGHPTKAEMDATLPAIDCPCVRCIDWRSTVRHDWVPTANPLISDEWTSQAACLGEDPAIFFPGRGESLSPARSICSTCTVQAECETAGMRENYGIWGGRSERDRRRLRKARRHDSGIDDQEDNVA